MTQQRVAPLDDVYDPPTLRGPDYIVQFKIRNGPLVRAMRMRGYRTITAFAKACGTSSHTLSPYFSLRSSALGRTGKWRPTVLLMAKTLRLPPDCLFPEQHLDKALARSSGEAEFTADEIRALIAPAAALDPEQQMIEAERNRFLNAKLCELTAREHRVFAERYGFGGGPGKTFHDVATMFGVSLERIRQVEQKALRKLRRPSRGLLSAFDHGGPVPSSPHYVPYWKRDEQRKTRKQQAAEQDAEEEARRFAPMLAAIAANQTNDGRWIRDWPEVQPGYIIIKDDRHYFVRNEDIHTPAAKQMLAGKTCQERRNGIAYFYKEAAQ